VAAIVEPGRNCWRIERAARASVIVDAADYFRIMAGVMDRAEQQILLIGWDFDVRAPLMPDEQGRGESLGAFMLRLARAKPKRDIAILKWSFGALKQWLRPSAAVMLLRWARTKSIRYRFDSAHPVGCSHHQKIAVIDRNLAVCGGIDMSSRRWDTSAHLDDDPHRRWPGQESWTPWHDVTMLFDGDAAAAMHDVAEDRWRVATGKTLEKSVTATSDCWPNALAPQFRDVDIAIARTHAAWNGTPPINEIELLYLDMIAAAEKFIYFENQYLTSPAIAAAIAERMEEDDPPEIVIVMPRTADGWLEQRAMDGARVQLVRAIGEVDRLNRFRIYVPKTLGGSDIYCHAKLSIVDDRLLRVGSSNMNNRSLALDSECDVAIDSELSANTMCGEAIRALRFGLLAEHLGVSVDEVSAEIERSGSMIAAIARFSDSGKRLELLRLEEPAGFDRWIADNQLLDPDDPAAMLEPVNRRGLWARFRRGRRWMKVRRARWKAKRAARRERML
jgi:phosphatidylserine/phosphatidylglycerophosphate/cardiolipin synthase-like enzyme